MKRIGVLAAMLVLAASAGGAGAAANPCKGPQAEKTCPRTMAYHVFVIYNGTSRSEAKHTYSGKTRIEEKTIFWSMRTPKAVQVYRQIGQPFTNGSITFLAESGMGVGQVKTETENRFPCGSPPEEVSSRRSETIRAKFSRGPQTWVVDSARNGPYMRLIPNAKSRRSWSDSGYTCRYSYPGVEGVTTSTIKPSSGNEVFVGTLAASVGGEDRKQGTFSIVGKFGDEVIWARGAGKVTVTTPEQSAHLWKTTTTSEWTWAFRFTRHGNP
jgi:hypothetical protein